VFAPFSAALFTSRSVWNGSSFAAFASSQHIALWLNGEQASDFAIRDLRLRRLGSMCVCDWDRGWAMGGGGSGGSGGSGGDGGWPLVPLVGGGWPLVYMETTGLGSRPLLGSSPQWRAWCACLGRASRSGGGGCPSPTDARPRPQSLKPAAIVSVAVLLPSHPPPPRPFNPLPSPAILLGYAPC
jgi:hypothetical protein